MKLNKKLVSLGLILLLLCWTGNIIYYKKHVLKEPIFLKHYYEIPKGMNFFRLFYIDNINSNDKIMNISFPEIGEEYVNFSESEWNSEHPYLMKIITVFYIKSLPESFYGKIITKAHIEMESGKSFDADIGKIYIDKEDKYIDNKALVNDGSSGNSDGTGSTTYDITKDIKILGIDSKLYEELKDIIQIKINGRELSDITFPIKLSPPENLRLSYSFNFENNDIRRNNEYNFFINILTEDLKGNKGSEIFNIHKEVYPDMNALKNSNGR